MKSLKNAFVSNLLSGSDFKVIDGVAMKKLKSGAVAKLSMATGTSSGHYDRLRLDILDTKSGALDRRSFVFSDLLEHAPNNHPNASKKDKLEIIEYCGWEWYINRPTSNSVRDMIDTINDYISFF